MKLTIIGLAIIAALTTVQAKAADCVVMIVDGQTGIVTVVDKATGKMIQFKASDAPILQGLHVGQSVNIDSAGQVTTVSANK
ncbi:MAG: hypothetical protein ACLQJR_15010 [Stellaceae bacterium]